jgi:ABC-type multidrug transport system ATPase subunit
MSSAVLDISGYSDPPRIRNLSLKVDSGELVLVSGNAGSGKSNLALAIAGLRKPARGRILISGLPSQKAAARSGACFVFQFPAFDQTRHCVSQLVHRLCLSGISHREASDMASAWSRSWGVPILSRQTPEDLTTSQSKLLELALVQSLRWDLIVMDEPLQGLDQEVSAIFLELLAERKSSGSGAILCLAQQASQLSDLADRSFEIQNCLLVERTANQEVAG